ncbi:hypothetical protein [uncultured Dechloromonas sp.]|uniref:hypothetical protein n=1 Tax=uncultured Dechloromonas sp. TaxID=171719 RepID=UPI0025CF0569|nr:hypothetical protein [uncultured Dechloromonas sp.]
MSIALPGRHRRLIYLAFAFLVLSGLVWLGGRYGLRSDPELPHPLEAWALKLHGAAAMLGLLALGSVLPQHVRFAWRARRNRTSGATMLSLAGILILTGYGLYYAADENLRPWISLAHWASGLVLPAGLIWHVAAGRRRKKPGS